MMILRDIVIEVAAVIMRSIVSLRLPLLLITMVDTQAKHHQGITSHHQPILQVRLQVTHLKADTHHRVDILLKVIHSSQAVIQQDLLELHQAGIQVLLLVPLQDILKLHLWAIQVPKVPLQALNLDILKVLLPALHLVIHKAHPQVLLLVLLPGFTSHMVNLQSILQFEQVFR